MLTRITIKGAIWLPDSRDLLPSARVRGREGRRQGRQNFHEIFALQKYEEKKVKKTELIRSESSLQVAGELQTLSTTA